MPTFSSQPETLTAVLTPKGFEEAVLHSGAEYVETWATSSATVQQRLVIIPDEHERHRQVEAAHTPTDVRKLHVRKLDELRWARDQILADPRIKSFLPSEDTGLWPSVEALEKVGNMVAFLKEHADAPPDRHGALSLLRALRVLHHESTYPGVYTLREVPLEGALQLYDVREKTALVPGAGPGPAEDTASAANTIPSRLERSAVQCATTRPFLLDVSATLSSAALDVVEGRLSAATQTSVLQHLGVSQAGQDRAGPPLSAASQWADTILQHRQSLLSNGAPLFMDVRDAVRTLGLSEHTLAAVMHDATTTHHHQTRLRVGAYATVIHLPDVLCVLLGKREDQLSEEEREAVRAATDGCEVVHVLACPVSDGVFTGHPDRLDAIAQSHFTSPLRETLSGSPRMEAELVAVAGPLIRVVRLRATVNGAVGANPFVVVHGNRVENGFQGDVDVVEHVKRQRQEVLDHLTEKKRLADFQHVAGSGANSRAEATPAAAPTGSSADARTQVHQHVVRVLSAADHPLSKKEISQHPAFGTLRQHPSFDRILVEALAELTETVSRKYVLK